MSIMVEIAHGLILLCVAWIGHRVYRIEVKVNGRLDKALEKIAELEDKK